ncbi:MAG: insulinase family protein [Streptococcaceae bacterium]|jgi:predicted Zn-dependent peptidase|nr:insulinase family protein [Streptococcaceae bacterium]
MSIQLKKGVQLTVIPTEKFKTIRLLFRFQANLRQDTIAKRTLLSSLLETNSAKYPSQTQMSAKLAELYGASFSTYVSRKGNQHWFDVSVNMINGSYLQEDNLLEEMVDFVKEALFHPNIKNGAFDEATFNREKENLLQYIDSTKDDKQFYAALRLNELFFKDDVVHALPSFGTKELYEVQTPKTLADYYQNMLETDLLHIVVLGDVEEEKVAKIMEKLPFKDREINQPDIFYTPSVTNIIAEQIDHEPINQSKLALAYHLPYRYDSKEYIALQVFNGIFGAYPHSKLFQNVREKQSMAYTIQSSYDSFRGILKVGAGIDRKNRGQVMKSIHLALEEMKLGQIHHEEINKTKEMLKSSYLQGLDRPNTLIEIEFMKELLPKSYMKSQDWQEKVDAVTIEDIKEVAKNIHLAAVYFLEGSLEEEN